jgi:hypothetical protein
MLRHGLIVGLAAATLAAFPASDAQAQKKALKPTKDWSGSVEDEALAKGAPTVITETRVLEELWKSWKLADKAPTVDFSKELVVLTTTRGSKLNLSLNLTEKGDLQVLGLATRDLRPGFRYVIASVSREGVQSVNGAALAKAKDKDKE